jgi:hypothetical protein
MTDHRDPGVTQPVTWLIGSEKDAGIALRPGVSERASQQRPLADGLSGPMAMEGTMRGYVTATGMALGLLVVWAVIVPLVA